MKKRLKYKCLSFLNWSVLTPLVCDVNFYDRTPVRFSDAVSLIPWTWCSWDALYAFSAGFLDVIGFCLLLGHSLLGPSSSWLTEGHSTHHELYAVVQVLQEENHSAQGTNPHPQKTSPLSHNSNINSKLTDINKGIKIKSIIRKERNKV